MHQSQRRVGRHQVGARRRHRHQHHVGYAGGRERRRAEVRWTVDDDVIGLKRQDPFDPGADSRFGVERQSLDPGRQFAPPGPVGGGCLNIGIHHHDRLTAGQLAGQVDGDRALADTALEVHDRDNRNQLVDVGGALEHFRAEIRSICFCPSRDLHRVQCLALHVLANPISLLPNARPNAGILRGDRFAPRGGVLTNSNKWLVNYSLTTIIQATGDNERPGTFVASLTNNFSTGRTHRAARSQRYTRPA